MEKLINPAMSQITSDRYAFYKDAVRQSAPIWSDDADAWLLFHYDTITTYIKDERFIANRKQTFVDSLDISSEHKEILAKFYNKWLMYMDNPAHKELRRKVQLPISKVNSSAAVLSKDVSKKIFRSRMVGDRTDTVDFINEVTLPFTNEVLSGILGISCEHYKTLLQEATSAVSFLWMSNPTSGDIERTVISIQKTYDFLNQMIEEHSYEEDKLLDRILQTVEDREERLAVITNITVDGHEPFLSSLNSLIFYYLHCLPKEKKSRPMQIDKFVHETLRMECPFPFCSRIAREDVTIENQTIKKGEKVIFLISAANRDPEHFPDPDNISLDTSYKKTLTFGTGAHFCSGAMITTVSLQEFAKEFIEFQRTRELEIKGYEWNDSFGFRSLKQLNIAIHRKSETSSDDPENLYHQKYLMQNQREYRNGTRGLVHCPNSQD